MAISTKSNIATVDEVILDLVAFAVANAGYTDEGTTTINGGTTTMFRFSKTTDSIKTYWWLAANTQGSIEFSLNRIQGRMMHVLPTDANHLTFSNGQRYVTNTGLFNIAPPYTGYTFFTDGIGVFMVLEVTSGVFCHTAFGNLVKIGVYDGGAYLMGNNFKFYTHFNPDQWAPIIDASHHSSPMVFGGRLVFTNNNTVGGCYVQFNLGGNDNKDFTRLGSRDSTGDGALVGASGTVMPPYNGPVGIGVTASGCAWNIWGYLNEEAPSTLTLRAPLWPVYMVRQNPEDLNQVRMIGTVPNVASVTMELLNNGDLVNTDWRVFSLGQKGVDGSTATPAGNYGIAYKEFP